MDALHRRVTKRIRELARARRMALSHLPDYALISRSHFWDIMGGRKSPTLTMLSKIARALDADVSDLVAPPRR